MKTTKLFAGALMLLSVLSCQKGNNILEEKGTVITCTFAINDNATKTTVDADGLTPLWAAGDEIFIYDQASKTNYKKITLISSGTPSSDQGLISTGNKSFTFTKPGDWSADVCAVYPYGAVMGMKDNGIARITFSHDGSSYVAFQDGTFGNANICAAKTSTTTMSFKNVGAILKFASKPSTANKVVIPVAGLAYDYQVSFSGDTPSLTKGDSGWGFSSEYAIGDGVGAVYIGVPAETIPASSTFTYKNGSSSLGTYTTSAANTVEANKIYNLGSILGALPGAFSVSATKQVQFAKGNLQASIDASGNITAWKFASNQLELLEKGGANTTIGTAAGDVDLFYWVGQSGTIPAYGVSADEGAAYCGNVGEEPLKKDWGTAIDDKGTWRTLTGGPSGEWKYLLDTRSGDKAPDIGTTTDARYAFVKVNGKECMMIFPDVFSWPDGISQPSSFNRGSSTWNGINYTLAEYKTLEDAGAVFLAEAKYGLRYGNSVYEGCSYRASNSAPVSGENYYAYGLDISIYSIYNTAITTDHKGQRHYGTCVRLVSDIVVK